LDINPSSLLHVNASKTYLNYNSLHMVTKMNWFKNFSKCVGIRIYIFINYKFINLPKNVQMPLKSSEKQLDVCTLNIVISTLKSLCIIDKPFHLYIIVIYSL